MSAFVHVTFVVSLDMYEQTYIIILFKGLSPLVITYHLLFAYQFILLHIQFLGYVAYH